MHGGVCNLSVRYSTHYRWISVLWPCMGLGTIRLQNDSVARPWRVTLLQPYGHLIEVGAVATVKYARGLLVSVPNQVLVKKLDRMSSVRPL
jgi:hypothetical protein